MIGFIIFITDYLDVPIVRLDVRECNPELGSVYNMLPLQDGTVLVNHTKDEKDHLTRLSDRGDVIRNLITTDKDIGGLIFWSNTECMILYTDGSLHLLRIEDGQVLGSRFKVPDVGRVYDGIKIDDDQVLLVDRDKGKILLYNMKKRNKQIVLDKLKRPTSVDKTVTDQGVFYIVNEELAHTIRVYNDRWMLVTSIGGKGHDDKCLDFPHTARVLLDKTIVVSNCWNHRITCFTIQGEFIGHVLKQSNGIKRPERLAVQYPYLWVAYGDGAGCPYNIKCYQIYH